MSLSDIPIWVYVLFFWYACGIYAMGSVWAAMAWEKDPLPTKGQYWFWVIALLGGFLLFYAWLIGDLRKGFTLPGYWARRLKKKVDRHHRSRYL